MSAQTIFQYTATCSKGLEDLLSQEITSLGGTDVVQGINAVHFQGGLDIGYKVCLWSRFGSRVLLTLADFPCVSDEDLYQYSLHFSWDKHLDDSTTFGLGCSLGETAITHSRYALLRVKDGLVDFFRNRYDTRPSVDTYRPAIRFHVHVDQGKGTFFIDLSGESLHRRGYRIETGTAPLKENLAAAIVSLSGFSQTCSVDYTFVDPMCGSGTLLIEAAMMFGESAPGLIRNYFGFFGWKLHEKTLWSKLIDEAVTLEEEQLDKPWPLFLGYDSDPTVVAAARKNILRAGLEDRITVKQAELHTLRKPSAKGFLVTNPPYGERLLEKKESEALYSFLGRRLNEEFSGYHFSILLSNPDLGEKLGLNIVNRQRMYNGPIRCLLLSGIVQDHQQENGFQWRVSPATKNDEGAPFFNRLRKNLKTRLRWAKKEQISCFRIYDRDLPDFNLTVDLYDKWVFVQEYPAAKSVDPKQADQRFHLALMVIRNLFDIGRSRVFIRRSFRFNKPSGSKKNFEQKKPKLVEITEGPCHYLVNFNQSRTTGLSLKQRLIHQRIHQQSKAKRFLQLFCSSGAATVQAATGGAGTTTTVAISPHSRDWCRQNLAINGFSHHGHSIIHMDPFNWLQNEKGFYDLIFLNPQRCSLNGKEQRKLDLPQSHNKLLSLAMNRLHRGGTLLFSTDLGKFQLDPHLSQRFSITDLSRRLLPEDCKRNPEGFRCWEFRL